MRLRRGRGHVADANLFAYERLKVVKDDLARGLGFGIADGLDQCWICKLDPEGWGRSADSVIWNPDGTSETIHVHWIRNSDITAGIVPNVIDAALAGLKAPKE